MGEPFSSVEPCMKEFSVGDPRLPLMDSCFSMQNTLAGGLFFFDRKSIVIPLLFRSALLSNFKPLAFTCGRPCRGENELDGAPLPHHSALHILIARCFSSFIRDN